MGVAKNLGFKTDLGPINAKKLAEAIEAGYEARNEKKYKKKRSFSASQLGYGHGKCPRYWYIAFNGAIFDETKTNKSWANMDVGIQGHERIERLLNDSGLEVIDIEKEVESEDPPIFGYIDHIIGRAGTKVVGEFKTTRTEAFKSRQAKMTPPDYHLIQILIYMKLEEAEYGFFLYEDKNDQSLLVIPIAMEDHKVLVDETFDWMRRVYKAFKDDELPERAFRKNSRVCNACPVQETCWDELPEGDIDIERLRL